MNPRWLDSLLTRLVADAPARALLLAPPRHPLREALALRLPALPLDQAAPQTLPAAGRYPLALVAGVLESLEAAAARELLAALRDRLAEQVLLWVDASQAPVDEAGLRALGFRVHARDGTALLCGFDAYDYKDRPDWLNARYWAHPERWDRERW